jgi:hypothetical protein
VAKAITIESHRWSSHGPEHFMPEDEKTTLYVYEAEIK